MTLLLDTHAFLWFVSGDARFSRKARRRIESKGATIFLSAASVWEMAIKTSLGRLKFDIPFQDYVEEKLQSGFRMLPVEWPHASGVADLPFHHRDPFDRLIVAQSRIEKIPVVTADPAFRAYDVTIVW